MEVTLFLSSSVKLCCKSSMLAAVLLMRWAVSLTRVKATVRAVRSVGAVATSEKALSMSLTAAPKPSVPP